MSAKRGRLGPLTVQDLIIVACNLRLLKEKEMEDKEFALEVMEIGLINNNPDEEEQDISDNDD